MTCPLLTPTPFTTVELGDATYTDLAVQTAMRFVLDEVKGAPATQAEIATAIEELAPWQPVTERGRITKRIGAYVRKDYPNKLSTKTLSAVGNYLATDLPSKSISYAITPTFDWEEGAFGDSASCFFYHGRATMQALTQSQACALLLYSAPNVGIGRAIVLPGHGGGALVINAYGVALFQVKSMLRVLFPNMQMHDVPAKTSPPSNDGGLFINLDTGILCDEQPHLNIDGRYVVPFRLPYLVRNPFNRDEMIAHDAQLECPQCHQLRGAEHFVQTGTSRTPRTICRRCYEGLQRVTCEISGRVIPVEDATNIRVLAYEHGHFVRKAVIAHQRYTLSNFCPICEHYSITGPTYYVSLNHRRYDHVCSLCVEEKQLRTACPNCHALKRTHETCYCQQERSVTHDTEPANPARPPTPADVEEQIHQQLDRQMREYELRAYERARRIDPPRRPATPANTNTSPDYTFTVTSATTGDWLRESSIVGVRVGEPFIFTRIDATPDPDDARENHQQDAQGEVEQPVDAERDEG